MPIAFMTFWKLLMICLKKLSTIHGRTKEEKYSGQARWDLIAVATERCSFPVFASGDVVDQESYAKALEAMFGIQGLIIGRGALRRPWIFHEIKSGQKLQCQPEAIVPKSLVLWLYYGTLPKQLFRAS